MKLTEMSVIQFIKANSARVIGETLHDFLVESSRVIEGVMQIGYGLFNIVSITLCNHYVPDFKRMGIGDDLLLSIEPRCKIMGLENSISYRVRPDHGCDVHDNSEYMRRYGIL